ncbi:hypothetical protein ACU6RU_15190 [Microbacterium sp. F1-18]
MFVATVGCVTLALTMTACSQGRIDPQEYAPYTVAQRADAEAAAEAALSRAADGAVLTEQTMDGCSQGQKNWWVQDGSAWTCARSLQWVVAAASGDPAEVIAGYRAHLAEAGCMLDEASFGMVESYWADYGVAGQNGNGDPYTVDDLPSASATCDNRQVGIDFRTPGGVELTSLPRSPLLVVECEPFNLQAVSDAGTPLVAVLGTIRS